MIKNKGFKTKEVVLLAISLICVIGILPFAIIRFINNEWGMAIFDFVVCLLCSLVFFHVWHTHKTSFAKFTLSSLLIFAGLGTIYIKGVGQTPWLFPSMVGVFFLLDRKIGLMVNILTLAVFLFIVQDKLPLVHLLTFTITLMATNLFAYAFSYQTHRQKQKLFSIARQDSLTKVLNRRAFNEALELTFREQSRHYTAQSLIMLDIDDFKVVNDQLGHDIGDQVLINTTEIITENLRKTDRVYRIGGEEFAILLYETSENSALNVAEDIRIAIEKKLLVKGIPITASFGISSLKRQESYQQWFKRADNLLYQAKMSGKNRVCCELTSSKNTTAI
ncbi:MAG: GGDEF domain-containing protein [Desulfobacteraceae bacterium]|nr:GGDEF domain-containing protein [Desulfobacteraceae bacterium]